MRASPLVFIWWAAVMLHIVCILEPYLTCGTWHNWVTQNCTRGFVGPCISLSVYLVGGEVGSAAPTSLPRKCLQVFCSFGVQ